MDSRGQLLKRQDIFNIERACGLCRAEKARDDMMSVAMWVKEHEESDSNPFFAYVPLESTDGNFILGELSFHYFPLLQFLFFHYAYIYFTFAGIQTKFQMDMCHKFSSKVICVDATHGTTQYKNFLLVTVLVVGDQGKGLPVAWFVINKETTEVLTLCFTALRERYVTC